MRGILTVGVALSTAFLGAALPATATADERAGWDRSDAPQRVLRDGSAEEVGMLPGPLAEIEPALIGGLTREPTPFYPGAIALVASQGVVTERTAVGHAVRWADPETELPAGQRVAMATDTIVDLASLSKLFTAVAVMQLVESGELALGD